MTGYGNWHLDAWLFFVKAMKKNTKLKELLIMLPQTFRSLKVDPILEVFRKNTSLTKLDLQIGERSVGDPALVRTICKKATSKTNKTMKSISFVNFEVSYRTVLCLKQCLVVPSALQEIRLAKVTLPPVELPSFPHDRVLGSSVSRVLIRECIITKKTIQSLMGYIEKLPCLELLDLNWYDPTTDQQRVDLTQSLVSILTKNLLKYLRIVYARASAPPYYLQATDRLTLFEALKTNTSLRILKISNGVKFTEYELSTAINLLESYNTTLRLVADDPLTENSTTNAAKCENGERLLEKLKYLGHLNTFGRGKLRSCGTCLSLAGFVRRLERVSTVVILKTEMETISVHYGLLRELPGMWCLTSYSRGQKRKHHG